MTEVDLPNSLTPPQAVESPAVPADRPKPHLTLRATSGWAALNFGELWHFRDLMFTLAGRDLKVRYKQTFLGVAWVVLQPLLGAGVFSFIFGKVAKLESDGINYFLFTFTGLLIWNIFNNTISKTSNSMVGNAHLISKVYFPRLVLPISSTFSTLIDFCVAMGLLAVMMPIYHEAPGLGIVLLPVFVLFAILLAMGIGLMAAALMVSYRDVGYVLPVIMQFAMYASPIVYTVHRVPEKLLPWYFLNPVSGLVVAFRWSLLNKGMDPGIWPWVGYSGVVSVSVFLAGAVMFKRMERKFVDVI